jgi:hypothetical protein
LLRRDRLDQEPAAFRPLRRLVGDDLPVLPGRLDRIHRRDGKGGRGSLPLSSDLQSARRRPPLVRQPASASAPPVTNGATWLVSTDVNLARLPAPDVGWRVGKHTHMGSSRQRLGAERAQSMLANVGQHTRRLADYPAQRDNRPAFVVTLDPTAPALTVIVPVRRFAVGKGRNRAWFKMG